MNPQLATIIRFPNQELPIPLGGDSIARIPFPMSEEDFDLLIATLTLWKRRLVPELPEPEYSI